jgi:hypothetical protein
MGWQMVFRSDWPATNRPSHGTRMAHCTTIQKCVRQKLWYYLFGPNIQPLISNIMSTRSVMSSNTNQTIRSILQSCGSMQLQHVGYVRKLLWTARTGSSQVLDICFCGATAQIGPRPPLCWGF